MAIVRRRPFGLQRLWDQPMWSWPRLQYLMEPGFSEWMPSMDVYPKDDDLMVKVELPGLKADGVDISLEEGKLTISGKSEHEEETEEEDYYRKERSSGSFTRVIPVPEKVTEDDIKANLKDGVLEVVVNGAAAEVPEKKKIPIQGE